MRNPFQTPFAAIFQNEVRLNSKRVAPYALVFLFAGNAAVVVEAAAAINLGGPQTATGTLSGTCWASLSYWDSRSSTQLLWADPVIRDFRLGVDPLIFSKPVTRSHTFSENS